jgi:RNA recognition motif-containing protein
MSSLSSGADTLVGVPNETLYVQNLNEKARIKDLKQKLHALFSPYGPVLDIRAQRVLAMRGQAFITFDSVQAATEALQALQGTMLWYKPLNIKFARFKSDLISKRLGVLETTKAEQKRVQEEKKRTPRLTRRQLMAQLLTGARSHPMQMGSTVNTVSVDLGLPNSILFLQNLPLDTEEAELNRAFSVFPGFLEVRVVPSKRDIAFVEYADASRAAVARSALDRHHIRPGHEMRVSFAKK